MKTLDVDDIERFIEEIKIKIYDCNRMGELDRIERIAKELDLDDWCEHEGQNVYHGGKIAIIGASMASRGECISIFKGCGINKDRLEYCDFNQSKTYYYDKLINNAAFRVIMFGPVPHSTTGKGKELSVISAVEKDVADFNKEQGEEVTKVIRLTDKAGTLKITSKGLKNKLKELIETGYITTDF